MRTDFNPSSLIYQDCDPQGRLRREPRPIFEGNT